MTMKPLMLLCALLAIPSLLPANEPAKDAKGSEPEHKEQTACKADVEKFCKDVTPGEGRLVACLKAHEDKLSDACKKQRSAKQDEMKDQHDAWMKACGADKDKLCADVHGPGAMRCLKDHEKELSKGCAALMAKKKEEFAAQHPKAAKAFEACRADQEKFCKDVKPGEGRLIQCMKAHEGELSGDCRELMGRKGRHEGANSEGAEGKR